ncbi:hypothetical protein LguiA_003180 [Lonicera macranthoides]
MAFSFNSFIAIFITLHLLSQTASFCQKQVLDKAQDLLFEEKTRLGSTPPTCHNKCNKCHPCMAVQVPTIPSHNPFQLGLTRPVRPHCYHDSLADNRYSNYKPLGWKCICKDHFYNP